MKTLYVEQPSDHDFTAFLAEVTAEDVRRDEVAHFTSSEHRRARFLAGRHDFDPITSTTKGTRK